jgi:hypothetical protein
VAFKRMTVVPEQPQDKIATVLSPEDTEGENEVNWNLN